MTHDELRQLAEKATPGPWHWEPHGDGWALYAGRDLPSAASPRAVLALLDEKEKAEAVLRDLACQLGVGGYNADVFDAEVFGRKIAEGIDMLLAPWKRRAETAEAEIADLKAQLATLDERLASLDRRLEQTLDNWYWS